MRTVAVRHDANGPFTILVRGLQILAGLVTFYGTLGMFTTAGVLAPNAIVIAGLVLVVVAGVLQRRAGSPWTDGLWLYLGAVALPLAMLTLPTWNTPECAPGAGAQTPDNYCIGVGSHAIVVASVIASAAAAAFAVRALGRR